MPYNIIVGRNEDDRKKFADKGTIFIGRHYVQMGQTTSLSNNILLDIASSHIILVSGKRGCLSGDTFIFTDKNYKKIEYFNEKSDKVYSFNKKVCKFQLEKAKLLKYKIKESIFRIKLSDGQELIATPEHPFLVKSDKKYVWKIAGELTINDKIVSILQLHEQKARGGINER